MSSFQNSESIKQAMYEELQNILSPDTNVRTSAEERLSQLKFTEGKRIEIKCRDSVIDSGCVCLVRIWRLPVRVHHEPEFRVEPASIGCCDAEEVRGIVLVLQR